MKDRFLIWAPWLIAVAVHGILLLKVGVRFHEKPVTVKPVLIFWGALFSDDDLLQKKTVHHRPEAVPFETRRPITVPDRSIFGRPIVDKPAETAVTAVKHWFKDDFLAQRGETSGLRSSSPNKVKSTRDPLLQPPPPLPPLREGIRSQGKKALIYDRFAF